MGVLLVLGVVVLIAAVGFVGYYLKKKRREELALAARQLGLEFSSADPFSLLGLPFRLFTRGDGRGIEGVMWGTWQGVDLKEFDYWYYEESTDSHGETSRSYRYFSCAVTEIAASCAHLTIEREGFFSRVADHLGFHDIEFESDRFNRAFQVGCPDRKFATDVIDDRMMQWLLSIQEHWAFELCGPYLMCYTKRLKPLELTPLLGGLKAFRDHIPRVVWSLYGTGATPEQQPPAPQGLGFLP